MFTTTSKGRRLATLAAACLLSVALPMGVAQAQKQKTKTPAATETVRSSVDYSVSIPAIESVRSNIDNTQLTRIFSGAIAENAEALADLDAESINVPQIAITVTATRVGERAETVITINDLALENVSDGVAASFSVGSIDVETEKGVARAGAMSAADFNIGAMLGLYGLVDNSGQTTLQTIYRDFSSEGASIEMEDGTCEIGSSNGAEFKARPLQTSFAEIIALSQALEDEPENLDPKTLGQVIRMYADILTAFETSAVTFEGFHCDIVNDDGRPMQLSVAGASIAGMSPGIYPEVSLDGFAAVVEGDGEVRVGNITIKQSDLTGTIATLESAPELVDKDWLEENARALIPAMGGFSLSDIKIDVPDSENPDARVVGDVGAFDLTLANYLNGIPTAVDVSASNIYVALPEDSTDEQVQNLLAFGLTEIDAGFRFAAAWDEAQSAIVVEDVSFTGADLATIKLGAFISNVTADLFSLDTDEALFSAMNIAVQSLDLNIEDAGLLDLAFAAAAADQGGDPKTLRPIFAGIAEGTVIGFMAGAADAAKLGAAVSSFVSGKSSSLNIAIEAKEPPGLGLEDFMAAQDDPTVLLEKVNISASAK